MRIDVSEIKSFRGCKRQWQLSSRNQYHLRPVETPAPLSLGTIFHEALAQGYLGVSLERVMKWIHEDMSMDNDMALLAMVPGYFDSVLEDDLEKYEVQEVEYKFEFPAGDPGKGVNVATWRKGVLVSEPLMYCGAIDLIVTDPREKKVYGFEHKTCSRFRDPAYLWLDEQPRLYTRALEWWLQHSKRGKELTGAGYTLGGIWLNEVKKLLRDFQYERTLCVYEKEDLDNFMQAFLLSALDCSAMVADQDRMRYPQPDYFKCQMCQFKEICETFMYNTISKDDILHGFNNEFRERTEDHLDEKTSRSAERNERGV